jgi:hypothetical protein
MTNIQGDQAPAKWQKMLKKFDNSSKTVAEQSMSSQTLLDQLWSSARFKKKIWTCATSLHHDNMLAHTSVNTTEFVTNNNMVIIPIFPTSRT